MSLVAWAIMRFSVVALCRVDSIVPVVHHEERLWCMAGLHSGPTRHGLLQDCRLFVTCSCRRYLYQAPPALGGDMFPNRQAALDWIHANFRFQPGKPAASVPQSGGAVAVSSVFNDGQLAQWALSDPDTSLMKQLTHSASLLDKLRSRSVSAFGITEVSRDRAVAHVVQLLDELAAPRVCTSAPSHHHGLPPGSAGNVCGSDARTRRRFRVYQSCHMHSIQGMLH